MKRLVILLFVITTTLHINAQYSFGIGYAGTFPLSTFQQENYKNGNGLDLYFLSKKFPEYSRIQAQVGVDLNVFNAGERSTSNVPTTSGNYATYYLSNHHSALSFKLRFVTLENIVRYHVDLDLGNRSFYSTEMLSFENSSGNQPPNSSNYVHRDKAYFMGITTGVLYQITDWLSLDAYTRVDFGKSANWLNLNAYKAINNIPDYSSFQYKTTTTPLLWAGISAIIHFNPVKFKPNENRERSPEQEPEDQNEPTYPTPEPPADPNPRGRVAR